MRRAAAAALVLLALGCRTALPPALPLPEEDPRPAALLADLFARSETLRGLRGLAQLAVDGPEGSLRSKQLLIAERPARLRIQILGFLNQTAALLVTDGEAYDLFVARDRARERGPVTPDLLYRVAGIALSPVEAVEVILGVPDPGRGLALAGAASLPEGGIRVLLADERQRTRRSLEFDPEGQLRSLAAYAGTGAAEWEVRYADRAPIGEVSFAHSIEMVFPGQGIRAELELSAVSLNPALGPETFVLRLPPDVSYNPGQGGRG